jgi:hypothetical protein
MQVNIQNIVYFVGRLAPMALPFLFVFLSIFNQDWRGLLYLASLLAACATAIVLSNSTRSLFDLNLRASAMCYMGESTLSLYPLSSVVVGFSFFYMILPMVMLTGGVTNWLLTLLMGLIVFVDIAFLTHNRCSLMSKVGEPLSYILPILVSYAIGGLVAYLFVLLITSTDRTDLLYFGTEGSGPLCKLSRNKKMRCSVYRNGELITTH